MKPDVEIRPAVPADAAACAQIYAPYVSQTVISFEETPPDSAELAARMARAWRWLVAERGGDVVGYAYGSKHGERAAYRWTADVSVYIASGQHRQGIGRALYSRLFADLRECGIWTLCAGITEPNPASVGLHTSLGFARVGTYHRVGWKAGAWRDVSYYELHLRDGGGAPAEPVRR